ncbi:MAG: ATP-binding protein [Chitinophagaceae bacterium]|nr:ATP-binding protein [Chitinophagaceae bacterium]
MFETEQICPYTGLRSFTEEESLYFKGREEDIDQATEQLQRNKFLMLTGASGDGKSSLIYAGIIPNARAGFLKSKYSQWCVADFRPERTPFQNLCRSIARQLDIAGYHTVEAELHHGFSAIIDLYKNSKRYIDPASMSWQIADDAGKAALKREAANLIILIDQFEEFFTNPENYHRGVPSGDANLVLNLLLETARIALDEDLPVYIVFTMRSDYIGQCASFRGLPEYIGFSQFFVPRLNRTQLQQVIEEPAILSGNRITRRLTERLIHDLTEGVDQLPILQHALNQVWHAADRGNEEMDLVHYAMVGGMPVDELPDEQVARFTNWFEELSPVIKACYHEPNLQNVLDSHTNKLYEQAAGYYKQKTGKAISDEDAKAVIKTAFICLTKIDQSRAVRNRMTLKEITNILGRPEFGTVEVGAVLDIFREPGNTFVRPFITDDPDSRVLHDDDVLDITHESLIRNWEYLGQWAKEEFDNYTVSLDFEQQLNRWVKSGNSNGFLLSIGPLTYFENWFNAAKPNAYWIARYLPEDTDKDKKLAKANQVLANAQDFLARSARKHVVTRTVMRYGPRRIAAVLGLIALLTLSSFAIRNYFRQQNNQVLQSVKEQGVELANIPRLSLQFAVPVITELLINGNVTIPEMISAVKDSNQKIRTATGIATHLVMQGRYEPRKQILQSLTIADSLLAQLTITGNGTELAEKLKLVHDYSVTAAIACYFNPGDTLQALVTRNAKRSAGWALQVLTQQPGDFTDMQMLGSALDNGINHKAFSTGDISRLLEILSPFENKTRSAWLENNYQVDKVLVRGGNNYGPKYNGLYQQLACLYAAAGNAARALQCIDTLLRYPETFYQNDYATHIENAANIAGVFYTWGTADSLDHFVNGYCRRKNISASEFYDRLVTRAMIDVGVRFNTNFYTGGRGQTYANTNIKLSDDRMLTFFYSKLKDEILKIGNTDERNFNLAVMLKNQGCLFAYRSETRGMTETGTAQFYKDAINYYRLVPVEYLGQPLSVIGTSGADLVTMPRGYLFLYPDLRVPFHPFEPRALINFYNTGDFTKYVLDNGLFDQLYQNADQLKYFETWMSDYQVNMTSPDFFLHDPLPFGLLERLAAKLGSRNANQWADLNILYLHLGDQAFAQNETAKGIAYLQKIQPEKLLNAFQFKNFNVVNNYSFELTAKAVAALSVNSRFDLAYRLINVFKKEVNRSSLYGYASQQVSLNRQSPEMAKRLLDSAQTEMTRLDNPAVFQPNRHQVAIALMYMDPGKNEAAAYRTIKNSFNKFEAIGRFSEAYALNGKLYKSLQQAPPLISSGDRAVFLRRTMHGFNKAQSQKLEWKKFMDNELIFTRLFLPYINENQ